MDRQNIDCNRVAPEPKRQKLLLLEKVDISLLELR